MSAIIRDTSYREQQFLAKIGLITIRTLFGYLAGKIITGINPITGSIYISSVNSVRLIANLIFKNFPIIKQIIFIGSIPLVAHFSKVFISQAIILEIITTLFVSTAFWLLRKT